MYIIIWEFQVKEDCEAEFEELYGPEGAWVRLFQAGEGYLGTELLRDTASPRRYLTLDRWRSAAVYEAFREKWVNEYQELEELGETLTERELFLGTMVTVAAAEDSEGGR